MLRRPLPVCCVRGAENGEEKERRWWDSGGKGNIGEKRTQHAQNLRVLLALLLEDKLALFAVILVLSATPVLASLSLVLRHCGCALVVGRLREVWTFCRFCFSGGKQVITNVCGRLGIERTRRDSVRLTGKMRRRATYRMRPALMWLGRWVASCTIGSWLGSVGREVGTMRGGAKVAGLNFSVISRACVFADVGHSPTSPPLPSHYKLPKYILISEYVFTHPGTDTRHVVVWL